MNKNGGDLPNPDEVLRRMLNTPPNKLKKKAKKRAKKPAK